MREREIKIGRENEPVRQPATYYPRRRCDDQGYGGRWGHTGHQRRRQRVQALRGAARLLVRPVHQSVRQADRPEGARDQSRLLRQSQGHRALHRQVPQGERQRVFTIYTSRSVLFVYTLSSLSLSSVYHKLVYLSRFEAHNTEDVYVMNLKKDGFSNARHWTTFVFPIRYCTFSSALFAFLPSSPPESAARLPYVRSSRTFRAVYPRYASVSLSYAKSARYKIM